MTRFDDLALLAKFLFFLISIFLSSYLEIFHQLNIFALLSADHGRGRGGDVLCSILLLPVFVFAFRFVVDLKVVAIVVG